MVFANAGHNLPYVRTADGVVELRATGMPLGLLPGMDYPEHEAVLAPGESVLLYSDGLVEAHDRAGDMFGFPQAPRAHGVRSARAASSSTISSTSSTASSGRAGTRRTTSPWSPLQRTGGGATALAAETEAEARPRPRGLRTASCCATRSRASRATSALAMDRVAESVAQLAIEPARLERLKTAVSEAAMNAIEYGSQNDPTIPIEIEAVVTGDDLVVRITDRGLGGPLGDAEEPDLEKKLAGDQKPRGWGLFLIKHMVDAMEVTTHGTGQTVTLTLHLEGAGDASHPVQS